MANKAIIYAIYPNKVQDEQCQKTFGCCRFVYNQMLTVQQDRYKAKEKHLSKMSANTYCNQRLKSDYPFLKEVDKFALTNAIYHLSDGYDRFFKHLGGFPKYKNKHKAKKSYTTNLTNGNIEVGNNYIKLPKLGMVKAKIHRKPNDNQKIKSVTITKTPSGKYYVSILVEYDQYIPDVQLDKNKALGLDYASHSFYVDSQGREADCPKFYCNAQIILAKEQRKLSHMKYGSNNYQKQKLRVARVQEHIANQRKDWIHKLSTQLANDYDYICVEDINMQNMAQSLNLGKSTNDNGFGMFRTILAYKLADRGKKLIKIDKWFPSSKMCRFCGTINKNLTLADRIWTCECGKTLNRDENAAINIMNVGLSTV